jgi:hypothetical protein
MGRKGNTISTQDMIDGLKDERNGIQSLNYEDYDDIISRLRAFPMLLSSCEGAVRYLEGVSCNDRAASEALGNCAAAILEARKD